MSRVHLGHSIRRGLAAMTATAWWALGALLLAALVVLLCTIPLLRAVFISATAKEATGADLKGQYALHDKAMDGYVKQIDGRSLFVIPPPFPQVVQARTPEPIVERPKPKDPGPTSYGGPAISAIINDTVWFSDGKKLAVGDPAKDDVAVSAIDAPWSATLAWKGKDFEVAFFERDRVIHPRPGALPLPPSTSTPEPAKKPEPPKTDASKTDATKPTEVKPGETKPGESKPGDAKPGEVKPAAPPPDGPETPKAPDPKATDPKATDPKATDPKTEGNKTPEPTSEPK